MTLVLWEEDRRWFERLDLFLFLITVTQYHSHTPFAAGYLASALLRKSWWCKILGEVKKRAESGGKGATAKIIISTFQINVRFVTKAFIIYLWRLMTWNTSHAQLPTYLTLLHRTVPATFQWPTNQTNVVDWHVCKIIHLAILQGIFVSRRIYRRPE